MNDKILATNMDHSDDDIKGQDSERVLLRNTWLSKQSSCVFDKRDTSNKQKVTN